MYNAIGHRIGSADASIQIVRLVLSTNTSGLLQVAVCAFRGSNGGTRKYLPPTLAKKTREILEARNRDMPMRFALEI